MLKQCGFCVAGLAALTMASQRAANAALVLEFNAAGYNTATGVLTPSTTSVGGLTAVGSGGTTASNPTVTANDTPSGASAITFGGTSDFDYTAVGPVSTTETFFAVVKPSAATASIASGGGAITGGANNGTLEYRLINAGIKQDALSTQRQDYGMSTTAVPTTGFSVIELVIDTTADTLTFYRNGVVDGSMTYAPTAGIFNGDTRFGGAQLGTTNTETDLFAGDIADFQQYNTAFTAAQSAAQYQALAKTYLTAVPEPASLGLLGVGVVGLVGRRRRTR